MLRVLPSRGRRGLLLGLGGATVAAGLLPGCRRALPSFHGTDLTGADWGTRLSMPDFNGTTRTLADFTGKVVLLFFGFVQCPDVCPTALTRAVEVRRLLGQQASRIQVLFVTVDPDRDTPAVLREYLGAFDPSFVGLCGDAATLAATARDFHVMYIKVPTRQSYTMDHTSLTYAFDPGGRLRLAIPHALSAADVVEDLRRLL